MKILSIINFKLQRVMNIQLRRKEKKRKEMMKRVWKKRENIFKIKRQRNLKKNEKEERGIKGKRK